MDVSGMYVDKENRGPSIHTATGKRFWVLDPRWEDVNLEDIAHSLSHLCRFNGHTLHHYSVAQHSGLVAEWVLKQTGNKDLALVALLHDAAEAYMGDVTRPLKFALDQVAPGVLKKIEEDIEEVILDRYDLHPVTEEEWAIIKQGDNVALATEMRDLLKDCEAALLHSMPDPLPHPIRPKSPGAAMADYLEQFHTLWLGSGRDEIDI